MAYSTSSPPALIAQGIGGQGPKLWQYRSTDAAAAVDAAGYIANGGSLGLAVSDLVYVVDTDAAPVAVTLHQVSAAGNGTTDLNDLTTITQTDSD
jgi:hypothetical protein